MAKGKPVGNIKLGISLEGVEFGNTLEDINSKLKQAESNMKANMKAFDSAGKTYEGLNQKTKDLTKVMDGQDAKIKELTKRRDEAIGKYGEESKQVANLSTQINNSSARYNAYSKQLNETKKEMVYSKTAVNDLTSEIKENERQMNAEVKALKAAGDESGAFEAKQKGLARQTELSEKAFDEQRKVVSLMADELGDSAKETEEARKELSKLERQSKLSNKQLEGFAKTTDVAGEEAEDFGSKVNKSGRNLDGFKENVSRTTGIVSKLGKSFAFMAKGAIFGVFATAGSKAVNSVSNSLDGAISRIDTLNNSDRAFSNMGFEAKETKKAMDNLQGAITGLPTGLDGAVKGVQLLAGSTEDVGKSVDIFKAMNDGILGFGGDAEMVDNAIVQLSQSFSNGKVDAETWNSMINSGLGPTLNAMAKQMGKTTGELKAGLSDGSVSVKEFQDKLIDLDKNGGGGIKALDQIAKDSSEGIKTSIANAKTAVTRGVASMITGLNDGLSKNKLPSLDVMISGFGSRIEATFKKIGKLIPRALDVIAPTIKTIIGLIKPLKDSFKGMMDSFGNSESGQQISQMFKTIGKSIEVVMGVFKTGDFSLLEKLGLSPESIAKIKDTIGQIKTYFKGLVDNVKNIFAVAWEIGKGIFESLAPYILPIIQKIGTALGAMGASVTTFWNQNGKQILEAIRNFFTFIQPVVKIVMNLIMGLIDNVIGVVDGLMNVIQGAIKIFTGIFTGDLSKMWEGIKQVFSGAIKAIWNWVQIMFFKRILQGAGGLAKGFKNVTSGMWTSVKKFFSEGIKNVVKNVVSWIANLLKRAGGLKTGFSNFIKGMWTGIKNLFKNGISNTWGAIKDWAKKMLDHILNLKTKISKVISELWTGIKKTFSNGIDKVVQWMKDLPGNIAKGIRKGKDAIKNAFKSVFDSAMNAVKKPINLIIDGASWVLEKLGADKIKHWKPKYAQGTDGHPGGMMMVNDGAGAEMVVRPNGQAFIPQGQNVTMYGEPGTQVIPAHDTAMIMGKKRSTFAYAKGTGGIFSNMWNSTKDWGAGLIDSVKKKIGDVMDYVTDPGKLVSKLLGSELLGNLTKWPLSVGKGVLSKSKEALTSKVKELFDSMGGGDFDGAMGSNGVYQYLVNAAKKIMAKFSGLSITSGYREGDRYYHGKHQALDIAFPSSMNGSPKNKEVANYAFEKFPQDIGYVITNGQVRDRSGLSGQGHSGKWTKWPDNDHYDHIHLNGSKGAGDISTGGGSVSNSNWAVQARRAAKLMKQNLSNYELNGLLAQIQRESGGNQKIIQSNAVWDENTASGNPAKGLLQYIPQTFNAFKVRGYENIFNGFHQLMAFFNNSNWKGDLQYGKSGWSTRGHRIRGFANGGIVNRHQIAEIAEGNKPEIIIPLASAKRSRAMQLLSIAMNRLGVQPFAAAKTPTNQIVNSGNANDNDKVVELLSMMLNVMSNFGDDLKNLQIVLDGKNVTKSVETRQRNDRRLNNILTGVRAV